jgi:uncharacterized protein (UPF0216 family)
MDDRVFTYIGYELAHLNDQLPKKRISLKKILGENRYDVKTKTGEHHFEKDEIAFLKQFVPREFWGRISLPLVLFRRKDAYTFSGNTYECFLIKQILTNGTYTHDAAIETEKEMILYTPQVIGLKKRFKSLFVIGFSI